MKYGYRFRLQKQNITWTKIKRDILNTIDSIKNKFINLNNGNNNDLTEWETSLKCTLNNKIRSLQNSHNLNTFNFGINLQLLNKQIDSIHKHFIITTIDKASNNFAFISYYSVKTLKNYSTIP